MLPLTHFKIEFRNIPDDIPFTKSVCENLPVDQGECPRSQLVNVADVVDQALTIMDRRLALLPAVLQPLDRQVKVALVQNGCYETMRFPTTERSWEIPAEKCAFDEGTLNHVRNLVNPPQSQQGKRINVLISSIASTNTFFDPFRLLGKHCSQ